MKLVLKKFQDEAIIELRRQFLELWKTGNRKINLTFKSPTGSGKTIMMAEFLKELSGDPQFNSEKAFIWITFSEDSYLQSKQKLLDYYGGSGEVNLLDMNDLNRKELENNNVFFINWQKLKTSTKDGRKLRKETEKTSSDAGIFDEFIIRTQQADRELVLIIDEAHVQTGTDLAEEVVNLINPRIILHITATPKNTPSLEDVQDKKAGFVRVKREEVVSQGLIKEKIVTQSKEDLEKISKKELDQDKILLELAINKRNQIKGFYNKLKINYINPLVLIQLPNDDKARKETLDKSKEEIVKEYLKESGIKENEIAVWVSEKKENLSDIEKQDSEVSFLIFKQAAATGWDCPRAHILIMFREIKTPIFHTQTVGRILRMPEAKHYSIPELNIGYLYTNYSRNQINMPDNKLGDNKPFIYVSKRKKSVKTIELTSSHLSRANYNDLGGNFQFTFEKVADKFFDVKRKSDNNFKKIEKKGIKVKKIEIVNKLIIDAEIEDYDNFIEEIKKKGHDLNNKMSINDIERIYNLLCFNIIAKQEEDDKKFAPERSWGRLKTALNVWFNNRITTERYDYYNIIVNDLLKENSVLRVVISNALEKHKPIREAEIKSKIKKREKTINLELPRESLFFTEDYSDNEIKVDNSSMEPFYIRKEYPGKDNEVKFIKYLEENKSVDWWYKQGDSGSENFGVKYFNEQEKKESLFYPDWIIRLKNNKIFIIDTKKGITEKDLDTKYKAEALQKWIKSNKNKLIRGGIAVNASGVWKINNKTIYNWEPNHKDWLILDEFLK